MDHVNLKMRCFAVVTAAFLFPSAMRSQMLTIDECQRLARENYPSVARFDIVEKSQKFNLSNAAKVFLPQVSLSGRATYQSDVTQIGIELPTIEIPVPDKDQYQIAAEVSQLIWDGGKTAARKEMLNAEAETEKQRLESELYAVRERVNNIFFGILLLEEQLRRQNEFDGKLQRNLDKVKSYKENGMANDADVSAVKAELLKSRQQRIHLESSLKAYRQILSIFTGKKIDENTGLAKPTIEDPKPGFAINRPELNLFAAQQAQLETKKNMLKTNHLPAIGAFVQGGYGKPGLNMFKNDFSAFFIGGIRFSWNFGSLYSYSNEKKNIDLQKMIVDSQRETFLFNLNMQIPLYRNEIEKYRETMYDDDEIIRLRKIIKESAEAKVKNGTMDVLDMLRELTEYELAKQAKSLHEIHYLMSIYNLKQMTN